MEPAAIASIIVSLIAALAGYASQRAAAKASTKNAATSSRTELDKTRADAEKEAYERARAFDTETIRRQDEELDELRQHMRELNADVKRVTTENEQLHTENRTVLEDNARLRAEVRALRLRFTRIERKYPTDEIPLQSIRERESDSNPMMMEAYDDGGE
jgi:chromosome segregation ATPase